MSTTHNGGIVRCICGPKLPCGCPKIAGPCSCGGYVYVEGDVDAYCEVHGGKRV